METRNPDIAFTRNPIRFSDSMTGTDAQRTFAVRIGGATAYTGHYTAPAEIDIAEICEACVKSIPAPEEGFHFGDAETMMQLEGPGEFQARRVVVDRCIDQAPPLRMPFYALPGGVSPQNYRRLRELDSDIFAARLLDKRHNFFLTTRTHGWRIVMDELELYPLTYVNLRNTPDSVIEVKAAGTEHSVSMVNEDQGIYAIDIERIRTRIAKEYGFLGSVFDVICDGYLACQIVIRESRPEPSATMVKFRNSLGAFELLHLSGATDARMTVETTRISGRRYDADTGRFCEIRKRPVLSCVLDTETGSRDNDEIAFILDMAASEEVYLRQDAGWTRVVPSIDTATMGDPQMKPTSIKVSFALADERDNQTPDIRSLEDFERPRIFSDEHTDEFN